MKGISDKNAIVFFMTLFLSTITYGMYDPAVGRFMQRDPLGIDPAGSSQNQFFVKKQYTDGMNLYEYVKSLPISNYDSYGLYGKNATECFESWQNAQAKARSNLGLCALDCAGVTGITEAKCAVACAASYYFSPWGFKSCMATCTGCNSLIGILCQGVCFRGFADEIDSAKDAFDRCMEKAAGEI